MIPLRSQQAMMRVQGKHGQFIVNQHDMYVGTSLIEYGEYCESEWRFFSRFIRENDNVIDAGANIGALAVPMARRVGPGGKVMAFEPQPLIFACLQKAAELNALPQLDALAYGLVAAPGIMETAMPDYESFGSFASLSLLAEGTGLKAAIVRLDDVFQEDRLAFIKMDIEGMETLALEGATETFRRFRPALYIENDKPGQSPALIEKLMGWNYDLWWHTTPMFNRHNFRGVQTDVYLRDGGFSITNINMVCLPRERADWQALIPKSLRPVTSPADWLDTGDGVIPSFADDVTEM